jgi:hypothetical protein
MLIQTIIVGGQVAKVQSLESQSTGIDRKVFEPQQMFVRQVTQFLFVIRYVPKCSIFIVHTGMLLPCTL